MPPSRNLRRASRRCFKRFCMLLRRTSSNSASGRPSTTRVMLAVEPWFLKPEHIQILRSFGTKCADCFVEWARAMDTSVFNSVSFCSSTSGKKETMPVGDSPSWSLHPQTKSKWSSRVGGKSTRMKPPPQPQPVYASRNDPKQFDTILPLQAPPGPHRAPTHPTFKRRWSCDGPRAPSSPSAITEILYDSPLILLRCCRMLRERPKRFNMFVGLKRCLEDSCLWIKSVLRSFDMPIFLGVWCSAARPLYQGTVINPHHATSSVPGESRQTKGVGVSQYFQARFFEWWFQHGILLTTATGCLALLPPGCDPICHPQTSPFSLPLLSRSCSQKKALWGQNWDQCQPASFHFLVSFQEHVRLIMINPNWLWPVTTQLLSIQVRPFPLLMYGIIVLAIAQHSTCQELSWNKGGKKGNTCKKVVAASTKKSSNSGVHVANFDPSVEHPFGSTHRWTQSEGHMFDSMFSVPSGVKEIARFKIFSTSTWICQSFQLHLPMQSRNPKLQL